MLGRILLDDDDWLVTASLLGKIKVALKSRGLTIKARRDERLYLLEACEALAAAGIPITPDSVVAKELFREFATAIFSRGGARWQVFFATRPADELVREWFLGPPSAET